MLVVAVDVAGAVPRIGRGGIHCGLFLGRLVDDLVVKSAVPCFPERHFAHGETHLVPEVCRPRRAGSGTARQLHAHVLDIDGLPRQVKRLFPPFPENTDVGKLTQRPSGADG